MTEASALVCSLQADGPATAEFFLSVIDESYKLILWQSVSRKRLFNLTPLCDLI